MNNNFLMIDQHTLKILKLKSYKFMSSQENAARDNADTTANFGAQVNCAALFYQNNHLWHSCDS